MERLALKISCKSIRSVCSVELPVDDEYDCPEECEQNHCDWDNGISPAFDQCEFCQDHEFSIWWKRMRTKVIVKNLYPGMYKQIKFEDYGSYEDVGSKLLASLDHPKCKCHLSPIEGDRHSEVDDYNVLLQRYFGDRLAKRFSASFVNQSISSTGITEASESFASTEQYVTDEEASTSRDISEAFKQTDSFVSLSSVSSVELPFVDESHNKLALEEPAVIYPRCTENHLDWDSGISPAFEQCQFCENHEFSIWWKKMRTKKILKNLYPERFASLKMKLDDYRSYNSVGAKVLAKLGHPRCRCHLIPIEGDLDSEADDFELLIDRYFCRFLQRFADKYAEYLKSTEPSVVRETSTGTVSCKTISPIGRIDLSTGDAERHQQIPKKAPLSQLGFAASHFSRGIKSIGKSVAKEVFLTSTNRGSGRASQQIRNCSFKPKHSDSPSNSLTRYPIQRSQTPSNKNSMFLSRLGSAKSHFGRVIKSIGKTVTSEANKPSRASKQTRTISLESIRSVSSVDLSTPDSIEDSQASTEVSVSQLGFTTGYNSANITRKGASSAGTDCSLPKNTIQTPTERSLSELGFATNYVSDWARYVKSNGQDVAESEFNEPSTHRGPSRFSMHPRTFSCKSLSPLSSVELPFNDDGVLHDEDECVQTPPIPVSMFGHLGPKHLDWDSGISPAFDQCIYCQNHGFSIWWKKMRTKKILKNLYPERFEHLKPDDVHDYYAVGNKLLTQLGEPKCRCHTAIIEGDSDSESPSLHDLIEKYFPEIIEEGREEFRNYAHDKEKKLKKHWLKRLDEKYFGG